MTKTKTDFLGQGGPRAPRTSFFSLAPAPGAAASLFHAGKCPGWRHQGELDTERLRVSTARAAPVWPLAISRVNLPLNNSRGYIYIYSEVPSEAYKDQAHSPYNSASTALIAFAV